MRRITFKCVLMFIVVASAVMACCDLWQHRVSQKARDWLAGRPDQSIEPLHAFDQHFLRIAGDGNVAIRFLNLDPTNLRQVILAQEMFCRGAYALYPHRAWSVPEGTVL